MPLVFTRQLAFHPAPKLAKALDRGWSPCSGGHCLLRQRAVWLVVNSDDEKFFLQPDRLVLPSVCTCWPPYSCLKFPLPFSKRACRSRERGILLVFGRSTVLSTVPHVKNFFRLHRLVCLNKARVIVVVVTLPQSHPWGLDAPKHFCVT